MRTTLKRGMGRAATLNGNGRAVLPPPVGEPMRRYRQPDPPPRTTMGTVWRVFGWLLLAIVVVASGIAGGVYLYGHETLGALAAHSKQNIQASKDKNLHPIVAPTDPATALVVGYDTRKGSDAAIGQESRSDTLMLVRADPTNDTLSILSFPRDLNIPIYCEGSDVPVATDRINSAWSRCGSRGTLDTVAHLTNLPINYLNTVSGPGGYAKIDLHPGYQKLDGQESLDFVRFRHTDSDLYRLARQQLFLEALKDRLASSFSLLEIPRIIGAVKGNVEVVKPGAGAPTINEIQSYAGLGYRLPPGHLFRNSIPNLTDCGYLNAEVCANPADITSAVQAFSHPDVTLPKRANAAALGRKVRAPVTKDLKPSQISTLVLNGTTVAGLARDTSYKLAVVGFQTKQLPVDGAITANAPSSTNYPNTVFFDAVQPNAKQAAKQLAVAMGPHTDVKPLAPDIAPYAQAAGNPLTVIVVGSAFDGEISSPEAHVAPTPTRQAPNVTPYPSLTEGLLRGVKGRVPFRLMVPAVVARNSGLTRDEPLRVFKPAPHKHEAVLTFYTQSGNVYWQVIQTDWTDAPVLRKPTGTYNLKDGRKLRLYTNGGNIHMAVLRRGKASYWVVNTLRDELSNETMLAIAKGLKPLGQ
jgi:anionic cell wall polymer biosynthesis LytR-Cps2A-Psr (LCP) family protein